MKDLSHSVQTMTADASVFREALRHANSVVERRNTIPVLDHILAQVDDGGLRLRGTDLDVEADIPCECHAEGDLKVLVSPRPVLNLIKGVSGPITLTHDLAAETLTVTVDGTSLTRRNLIDAGDFPEMAKGQAAGKLSFSEADLKTALGYLTPCISKEETRYYLNGVFLTTGDNENARMVATDGHRLAMFDFDAPAPARDTILPRKTLKKLATHLRAGGNREVALHFFEDAHGAIKLTFEVSDIAIHSKVIDGSYPDYRRIIPEQSTNLDCTVTPEAARRAMALWTSGWVATTATLKPADGMMVVKNGGDNEMCIRIASSENPKKTQASQAEISFSAAYLHEMTKVAGTLRIQAADPASPARATNHDPRLLLVLMPRRA